MNKELKEFIEGEKFDILKLQSEKEAVGNSLKVFAEKNDFTSDEYILASQRAGELSELLENIQNYRKVLDDLEQAESLAQDDEMAELAQTEIEEALSKINELKLKLQKQTQENLRNDDKKAILEFRPGVGGIEAALFADILFRMYTRYCNDQGMELENIALDYNSEGGIKEAIFIANTPKAYGKLRFEGGVHRVQRIPVTESAGRIHTSTASVAVMPFFDKKSIDIKDEDLRIDVYRSSGPGGQSVNTTDSAVRITHIPTGIVVTSQSGKSQHKNKDMALSILASKLQEIEDEKKAKEENDLRAQMLKDSDRSAKIRTYNFPQGRVTDHRVKKSWFNIDEIVNGEIEEMLNTVAIEMRSMLEGK